jgi:hypothetical protein
LTKISRFNNFIKTNAIRSNLIFCIMKRVAFSFIFALICILVDGQVPESFNYQAIPRNSSGRTYPDRVMKGRLSFLAGSSAGTPVYIEIFSAKTNSSGILNFQAGKGIPVKGDFASIKWKNGTFFLKVEIDPEGGTSYTISGVSGINNNATINVYNKINISPGGSWRPFNYASVWNTKIPDNPEIDHNSDAIINDMLSSGNEKLGFNITNWSIPVWEVDETITKWSPVTYAGNFKVQHQRLLDSVPIPVGVNIQPDPEIDHHLCIINKARTKEWDFWGLSSLAEGATTSSPGHITTNSATMHDLTGTGYKGPDSSGCRASGFPLIAGLIRYEEVVNGSIDHALVFAGRGNRYQYYAYPPATETDGHKRNDSLAVPEGALLQLNPAIDINSLGLNTANKIVARALQEYGMYNSDNAGDFIIYAENFVGKTNMWTGNYALSGLPFSPRDFRVIKLPPLLRYTKY